MKRKEAGCGRDVGCGGGRGEERRLGHVTEGLTLPGWQVCPSIYFYNFSRLATALCLRI